MAKDNTILLVIGVVLAIVLVLKFGPGLLPQQQAILYNCNVCDTNPAVLTNEKLSCEASGWQCTTANNCLTCTQSSDVNSCQDSDTSYLPTKNYALAGHTTNVQHSVTTSLYDECVDGVNIREAYCSSYTDGTPRSEVVSCGPGKICQSGRCIVGTCTPDASPCGACNAQGYKECDDGCGRIYTETTGCTPLRCTYSGLSYAIGDMWCINETRGGYCVEFTDGTPKTMVIDCPPPGSCYDKQCHIIKGSSTCASGTTRCDDGVCRQDCGATSKSVEPVTYTQLKTMTSGDMFKHGCAFNEDCINGTCETINSLTTTGKITRSQAEAFYGTFKPIANQVVTTGGAYGICSWLKTYLVGDPSISATFFPNLCTNFASESGNLARGVTTYITALQSENGNVAGICIKPEVASAAPVAACEYQVTGSSALGFEISQTGTGSRCIPENCSYIETTSSLPTITYTSECCEGLEKKETGRSEATWTVPGLGVKVDIASVSTGTCIKAPWSICSIFGFLRDALPEEQKDSACILGIAGAALFLLVLLKGLTR